MLWRIVRDGLAPHRGALSLLVVLQLVSTIASLYLPNLNAAIIEGVAKGGTREPQVVPDLVNLGDFSLQYFWPMPMLSMISRAAMEISAVSMP